MLSEAMHLIARQDGLRVWLVNLQQHEPFQSPCSGEEFVALVAVYDSRVTNDNRNKISAALIEQGCRYGVCFGYECSIWDDALDWSFLATDPGFSPPGDRFVMTTWHEDESLEDTISHFLKSTSFDNFNPRNFVVLMLGNGPTDEITAAVHSELEASRF